MARFDIEKEISALIKNSLSHLYNTLPKKEKLPADLDIQLDIPKDLAFGDLTTNIAMRIAPHFGRDSFFIAEELRAHLERTFKTRGLSKTIGKVEVKKPGFVNFWFTDKFLFDTLLSISKDDKNYGTSNDGRSRKVLIEFVSANPTGPLTIAHGRQAAIGDALARILAFSGYDVTKEYFINDEGRQIEALGESILYHYLSFYGINIEFPEGGYKGDYIKEIAQKIKEKYEDRFVKNYEGKRDFFKNFGVKDIMETIKKDLTDFAVFFDYYFKQSSLSKSKVTGVLDILRKKDFIYKRDGATWFRSSAFGDEKDRVVIKSDGSFTYLGPDIAYHLDKYKRGFEHLIDIWGPDHHGYVPRLKAACRALGYKEDSISILLVQLATLYRGEKALSMSTRKGEFITLREVSSEVGKDVTRFFFLMRKLDSHLDFDLEVAKSQSQDNPVYYIQYAHARIWSIKEHQMKVGKDIKNAKIDLGLLKEKEELAIARLLCQFPKYVRASAKNLEPYIIIMYLNYLAKLFHDYYTKHRVISQDTALSKTRLFFADCVRICLANGLGLLGVSLPKRM